MTTQKNNFQELLDKTYEWPASYTFKFIIPSTALEALTTILDADDIVTKPSKNKKYTSVSIKKIMKSSDEVMDTYKKASTIEGIISL